MASARSGVTHERLLTIEEKRIWTSTLLNTARVSYVRIDDQTVPDQSASVPSSLSLVADGSFTYTSDAAFTGTDSFTYAATNGAGSSSPTAVTITVRSVDRPPTGTVDRQEHRAPGAGPPHSRLRALDLRMARCEGGVVVGRDRARIPDHPSIGPV